MNSYYITIDNNFYCGESEEIYKTQDYDKSGWYPKESYIPKIILSEKKGQHIRPDNLKIITCEINLNYHLSYIFKLQKYKLIKFSRIEIIMTQGVHN